MLKNIFSIIKTGSNSLNTMMGREVLRSLGRQKIQNDISIVKRKLRKLVRDPKRYFRDWMAKRNIGTRFLNPEKEYGISRYTVISACYNVEKYINDYFTSVIGQSLNFVNNIQLIMVDDGSTDNTAEIIKQWQQKYPQNIKYIYKENGGQADARNVGLQYVTTEFVTFIDPDDFIDINFFKNIDTYLEKNPDNRICMIASNILFYYEKNNKKSDTHPLKFKFSETNKVTVADLNKNIQLHSSSTLFKKQYITNKFSIKIKPDFEDAHFVACYLSKLQGKKCIFLKDALYFYRKREDKTSTLDGVWERIEKYDDVLRYGKLDILERYSAMFNDVPQYIKNTILYDLIWYFKYIIDSPEKIQFLSEEQKNNFKELLNKCFSYFSLEDILSFSLAGCWFYHKVGIINLFKKETLPFQIVYIERFNSIKNQIFVRYFSTKNSNITILIEGREVFPRFKKVAQHDFCGELFVAEYLLWIPISEKEKDILTCSVDNLPTRITLSKKQFSKGVAVSQIRAAFPEEIRSCNKYTNCWIVMDRDTQADDNAEHLYRYIQKHHPEIPAWFVLRKGSPDWKRLADEGFSMLEFGSKEHERALHVCDKIISSHIDTYVMNYFRDNSLNKKKIIFLQHGIMKDDMSHWMNSKPRIDLFITSSIAEYHSIVSDGSRYKLGESEVVLTGLPRHDRLLRKAQSKKEIIIMPTWRNNLMGKQVSGNIRLKNEHFMESKYAQCWMELLKSQKLYEISYTYGYSIVFYPHTNIQPYIEDFNIPGYIVIKTHTTESIQNYFIDASCMITDFSSVAFDVAYLEKPIIYYQFDENNFYNGAHTLQRGYFSYRKDGFGPVCIDVDEVLNSLENILKNDCKVNEPYLSRMESAFAFKDGCCCERVFNAITNLDKA